MSANIDLISNLLNEGYFCKTRESYALSDPNSRSNITLTFTKDLDEKKVTITPLDKNNVSVLLQSKGQLPL